MYKLLKSIIACLAAVTLCAALLDASRNLAMIALALTLVRTLL